MRKPIITQQTTGYFVTVNDRGYYEDGHGWFSKAIAREHAKRLGGWYELGQRGTVKEVITGYEDEN